jgi:beta-mannosidase
MAYLTDRFHIPSAFSDLVYLTQILQAECIRTGVEHWRRNRPRCSGALYWQLNDCWPVTSWAGIDYAGRWKALQYAARRFYAPVALSIEDKGSRMSIFVANDYPECWHGTLNWSLETLDGEKVQTGIEAVTAQPLSATCIRNLDFASALKSYGASQLVFVAELCAGEQRLAWQAAFFAPEKKITFENPALNWNMEIDGRELVIKLTAQKLARFVSLELKGADPIFSDNFFDLPAGWSSEVRCPLPSGWTLEQAKAALRIHSLADVRYAGSTAVDKLQRLLLALDPVSLFSRALYSFIE